MESRGNRITNNPEHSFESFCFTKITRVIQFGVVASGGNIYVHYADAGCGWCAGPTLVAGTSVNTWYRLTITVDDGAGFKVEIKQRDTGAGYASYTRAMNLSSGRNWRFQHFMYTAGTAAYMDNYVETIVGPQTTAYVGNHYECVPGQACTSYYYFNGQRIAMRQGVPVTYLHGDSLGSASLTTSDATPGVKLSELRYTSFGEVRYQGGQTATDKRFTGQRQEAGIGLYDYGARFDSYIESIILRPAPHSFTAYAPNNARTMRSAASPSP